MTKQKHTKRLGALLSGTLLFSMLLLPTQAEQMHILVDGSSYDGPVLMQNSTTYIPMRHFLTELGWTVQWDSAHGVAAAQKDGNIVSVDPSRQTLTVNGQTLSVSVPSQDERLYLPLRTLGAFLDYSVEWNGGNHVSLTSGGAADKWSGENLYWLSRIICAEAGGESLAGQVAVGNVVLNRVDSDEFPNTIHEVIFDRKHAVQFEPVSNGTVYNEPTETSVQAAKLALQGVNTAGKSLYFFNPSLSQGTWIADNRAYYTTIGCHQFYL